jgi:thioredoxin-like negative regulator of GroEL
MRKGLRKMNNKITKIYDSDFDSKVLFPRKTAVVFFSANWSESSRTAYPIFAAAAEKYRSEAAIYEMDVDENSIIPIAYGVRRLPAVLTFANGRLDESHSGAISEEKLTEKIEKLASAGRRYQKVAAVSRQFATRIGDRVGWLLSELF